MADIGGGVPAIPAPGKVDTWEQMIPCPVVHQCNLEHADFDSKISTGLFQSKNAEDCKP